MTDLQKTPFVKELASSGTSMEILKSERCIASPYQSEQIN
jgi:hypothetical protein